MTVPDKKSMTYRNTVDDIEEPVKAKPPSDDSRITYILQWGGKFSSGKSHNIKSDTPFDLSGVSTDPVVEPEPKEDGEDEAAFHITRTVSLWEPRTFDEIQIEKVDAKALNEADARDGIKKDVTFKDLHITSVGGRTITIKSETLFKAIDQCVEYYPYGYDPYPPDCYEPYELLVYHLKELRELSESVHAR